MWKQIYIYKLIYKGCDMLEFNHIRDILDNENIPYKYFVRDTKMGWLDFLLFMLAKAISINRESVNYSKEYYLFVSKKNKDKALKILGML